MTQIAGKTGTKVTVRAVVTKADGRVIDLGELTYTPWWRRVLNAMAAPFRRKEN